MLPCQTNRFATYVRLASVDDSWNDKCTSMTAREKERIQRTYWVTCQKQKKRRVSIFLLIRNESDVYVRCTNGDGRRNDACLRTHWGRLLNNSIIEWFILLIDRWVKTHFEVTAQSIHITSSYRHTFNRRCRVCKYISYSLIFNYDEI